MDKFRDYLHNNFKLAYKSVRFHFKKFACFYIVLFIIELLIGTVCVSMNINRANIEHQTTEHYKSHCVFYYMNTNQKYYLKKSAVYYFDNDHFFDIKDIKEYGKEEDHDYKCDVSILFAEDPEESLRIFEKKYLPKLESLGSVYMSTTPLFELDDTLFKYDVIYGLYLLIVCVFSFVLLAVLYNIHSNGSGFEYGIYMSFGANRTKLFNTSFWELTVISLLTLLPSVAVVGVLNYILAKRVGIVFSIGLWDCVTVFFFTLVVVALAVFTVVTKTARKTPVSLLSAQDNSNWVHSPRRSRNIFTANKTVRMRTVGFLRYYKYYVTLTLSTVLFASLFVCGGYCAKLYNEKQEVSLPQFEVLYSGNESYDFEDNEYYLGFDGIVGTYKKESVSVMGLNEHILIPSSSVKMFADSVEFDSDYEAIDNITYFCADAEVVENLSRYEHTGDLNSILQDKYTVIMSDSYCNKTKFDFKPGDKIKLADFLMSLKEPSDPLMGNDLLQFRIDNYLFLYKEVTVGAVIHNENSDFLNIYLPSELYTEVTGRTPAYKQVMLFADEALSQKQINKLYSDILAINQLRYREKDNSVYVFVKNLHTGFNKLVDSQSEFSLKLMIISSLVLCVSGVLWFFSQIFFYKKRNNEYTLLRTIGFSTNDIRKMFLTDALIVSVLGLILYFVLSYGICYGVYYLMNSWLFDYTVRYTYQIPWIFVALGAVATVAFSFISTFVCYGNYRKTDKNVVPKD